MSAKQIIRVRDVMEANFHTIDGMATITDALQAMKKLGAQGLIVDKRHDDDEYGIVLISDIAREVLARDRSPHRVNVYEVMAKPVITVDPEMDIRYCARLFTRFELSRAPVVENSRVVGIVSFSDLVLEGLYRHI